MLEAEMTEEFEELWKELLKWNPTNSDLCYVIREVEPFLRKKPGRQVLKQNPTNDELACVIVWVESLKEEAWQKLSEQGPPNSVLCNILRWEGSKSLREKIGRQVLKQNPTNDELWCVAGYVEDLEEEAIRKILEHPTHADLRDIIENQKPLREKAERLLQRPKDKILEEIRKEMHLWR